MIVCVIKYDNWYVDSAGVLSSSYSMTPTLSTATYFHSEEAAKKWLNRVSHIIDNEEYEIVKVEIKELEDD